MSAVARAAAPLGARAAPAVARAGVSRPVTRRRPRLLWLLVALLGVVPWFVEAYWSPSPPDRVVLRSVAFALECLAALFLIGARARRGWGLASFRLGPWYLVWTGVQFGLVTIVWRTPQPDAPQIHLGGVLLALSAASLALPCWTAGYLLGPGRRLLRAATGFARAAAPGAGLALRGQSVPWVLCAVSAAARIVQIMLGQFAYLGDASQLVARSTGWAQPLVLLGGCGLSALLIATIDLARYGGSRRRLTFAVVLGVEIAFALVSGMKGIFATTILGACIAFAVARGRLPMRWIVATGLVFVFVIIPYNASYRSVVRGQDSFADTRSAVMLAPTVLGDTVTGRAVTGADSGSDGSLTDYLLSRTRAIDSLAIVRQLSPGSVPYHPVDDLLVAPVLTVIPRAIWPGKPIRTTGYDFKQEYLGGNAQTYSSAAVSPQADLYRHGGLLVLLVGMGLLGAAYRLFDEAWSPLRDLRHIVLFVPFFNQLTHSENSVGDLLALLPVQLLVLFAVSRYAYGGRRPAGQGSRPAARADSAYPRWPMLVPLPDRPWPRPAPPDPRLPARPGSVRAGRPGSDPAGRAGRAERAGRDGPVIRDPLDMACSELVPAGARETPIYEATARDTAFDRWPGSRSTTGSTTGRTRR